MRYVYARAARTRAADEMVPNPKPEFTDATGAVECRQHAAGG